MTAHRILSPALLACALSFPFALAAQGESLPGYSSAAARQQRAVETSVIARPDADSARRYSHALSSEVHISGTPAQARTRDYVIAAMKRWGLQTEVRTYDVWMPHTTNV